MNKFKVLANALIILSVTTVSVTALAADVPSAKMAMNTVSKSKTEKKIQLNQLDNEASGVRGPCTVLSFSA